MLEGKRYYSACLFLLNQVVKIMPFEIPTDPIQTSKNFFLIIWWGHIFCTKAKYNYVSHDSEKIQWSKKDIFYQALSSKRKIIFLTIYLIMHALLIIISYNYNDWCLPKTSAITVWSWDGIWNVWIFCLLLIDHFNHFII